MYVNWTPKLRRYIINQWKLGITPVSEIAINNRRVPRRTIYYLIERYKKYGYAGLEILFVGSLAATVAYFVGALLSRLA